MTGAYVYSLLKGQGHEIDVFDNDPGTKCGISPCAWGTSRRFYELVKAAGLDPVKYILRNFDYVVMDGLKIKADLMTFNKPRLVKDLLQGSELKNSSFDATCYDRIIDTTGTPRAFLPAIEGDLLLPCIQYRIQTEASLENCIKLGGIGYAWCFPLSENEYHIGCGSLLSDPHKLLEKLGWIEENKRRGNIVCACSGKIRLTGPQYSQPFVTDGARDGTWGAGEAIGCVAPLAGDGIVPGMRSVQILMDCWDDPSRYTKAILKEFHWMKSERKVINKLKGNEPVGVNDAWILKKNSKRMGMQVGLRAAAILVKHLR